MKHRFGQERKERKLLKAAGKWPARQKQDPPFVCEKVLADAPIAVQDLLINYKSAKKPRNMIVNEARIRQPYMKLSDAKKKSKGVLMYPLAKKQGNRRVA